MSVRIICGDALTELRLLPDESVHCCVTSPPYWGLRDYGVTGQLGLEADFRDYIAAMVAVFGEVRRVLRPDATLWLNLGDSYAGSWGADGRRITESDEPSWHSSQIKNHPKRSASARGYRAGGLKAKDLIGTPWRVAFALQQDGWYLRSDIIWSKPNPMPESVTDRPTKAHEYLFLLSRSERYHYDAAAIREIAGEDPGPGIAGWAVGEDHSAVGHNVAGRAESHGSRYRRPNSPGAIKSPHGQGFTRRASGRPGGRKPEKFDELISGAGRSGIGEGLFSRNKRSVWTVATAPYSEAHFATFPPALIEPCILAGCPEGGTVLDPFGGAGTTGLVADRLGRNAILIELNLEYAQMARRRIEGDAPLLACVS